MAINFLKRKKTPKIGLETGELILTASRNPNHEHQVLQTPNFELSAALCNNLTISPALPYRILYYSTLTAERTI